MPRNIEYLIDRHLAERDYVHFVLIFAIARGICVPQEILEQFGSGYGIDTQDFLPTKEKLQMLRDRLASLPEFENPKNKSSEKEIRAKADETYERSMGEYQNNLHRYTEAHNNLMYIRKETQKREASDRLQMKFKKMILSYVDSEILKLKKQYASKLIKPKKPDKYSYHRKAREINESERSVLRKRIRRMEKELYIDAAFSEKLAREWLNLK